MDKDKGLCEKPRHSPAPWKPATISLSCSSRNDEFHYHPGCLESRYGVTSFRADVPVGGFAAARIVDSPGGNRVTPGRSLSPGSIRFARGYRRGCIRLSAVVFAGACIISGTVAPATETVVSVTAVGSEVGEGRDAAFDLRRDNRDGTLKVRVSVSTRTAEAFAPDDAPGVKFGAPFPTTVTFSGRSGTARLEIGTTDDSDWQAHTEVVVAVVGGESYRTLPMSGSATVLVKDDDLPDAIDVGFEGEGDAIAVSEGARVVVARVGVRTRDGRRPHREVFVFLSSAESGAAVSRDDFEPLNGVLVFSPLDFRRTGLGADAAWQQTQSFGVRIIDDPFHESTESFSIHLSSNDPSVSVSKRVDIVDNDPLFFQHGSYFKASEPSSGDMFGQHVAVSADGGVVAVSAPFGEAMSDQGLGIGAVYVFRRNAEGAWREEQIIKLALTSYSRTDVDFTIALSADGGRLAVGVLSQDQVHVYGHVNGAWTREGKAVSSGNAGSKFGHDLALNGDGQWLVVAAAGDAVYVYERSPGDTRGIEWAVASTLRVSGFSREDFFGNAVAINEDATRIVVGVPGEDSEALPGSVGNSGTLSFDDSNLNSGLVYEFNRGDDGVWTDGVYFKPVMTGNLQLGWDVSLNAAGDVLAAGERRGRMHVYRLTASGWSLDDTFRLSGGESVVINAIGNQFAWSAPLGNNWEGAVHVWRYTGSSWEFDERIATAPNAEFNDRFGSSLALDGAGVLLVVGAPFEDGGVGGIHLAPSPDGNSLKDSGAVYLFKRPVPVSLAVSPGRVDVGEVATLEARLRRTLPGTVTLTVSAVDGEGTTTDAFRTITIPAELSTGVSTVRAEKPGRLTLMVSESDTSLTDLSEAVTVLISGVKVSVDAGPEVSEGEDAVFTLTRIDDDVDGASLSVLVSVSTRTAEAHVPDDAPGVRFVTPFSRFRTVTFDAGNGTTRVSVQTANDEVWQAHTDVIVTVVDGGGYRGLPGASSAAVLVRDDDLPGGIRIGLIDLDSSVPTLLVEESTGTFDVKWLVATSDRRRPHGDTRIAVDFITPGSLGSNPGILAERGRDFSFEQGVRFLHPSEFKFVSENDRWEAIKTVEFTDLDDAEKEIEEVIHLKFDTVGDDPSSISCDDPRITCHPTSAFIFVIDDDSFPPSITSADRFTVIEGTTMVAMLTASDPNAEDVLRWSIIGGDDAPGFIVTPETGELSFKRMARIRGDSDGDSVYTVVVRVDDGGSLGIPALSATQRIVVTVASSEIASISLDGPREVNEGGAFTFVLGRTGDPSAATTVGVSVLAEKTSDPLGVFAGAPPGEAFFAAGSSQTKLVVRTRQDLVWEEHTTVTVSVVGGVDYRASPEAGSETVKVLDDDIPEMVIGFSEAGESHPSFSTISFSVSEASGGIPITVIAETIRDELPRGSVMVGISARTESPSDFELSTNVVTFAEWERATNVQDEPVYRSTRRVFVTLVNDNVREEEEFFIIELRPLVTARGISPGEAYLNVVDDDFIVSVEAEGDGIVEEGSPALFTLTRAGETALRSAVRVSVSGGETGVPGSVFIGAPVRDVFFEPGASLSSLVVDTRGDGTWNAHTMVTVTVLPGSDYVVSPVSDSAAVQVRDDDVPEMMVGFVRTRVSFAENADKFTVTVFARTLRDEMPHGSVSLSLVGVPGSRAERGDDYVIEDQELNVEPPAFLRDEQAGFYEAFVMPVVRIVDDGEAEEDEAFELRLTTVASSVIPPGVISLGGNLHVVILDDDYVSVVSMDETRLNVTRGGEAELGLSLSRERFSKSTVGLTATPGLTVSPPVVEFASGLARATARVSADVDAPLSANGVPSGEVFIRAVSSRLEPGASSRVPVVLLPRSVALTLSREPETPLVSGGTAWLVVTPSPPLVEDEMVRVSVSSSSPELEVLGAPMTLGTAMPTASAELMAGRVNEDVVVTLTASAVPENVVVDARTMIEVVVMPKTITVRFAPSVLALAGDPPVPKSVAVSATLSDSDTETLIVELVPSTNRVTLTPSTVTLTGANPSVRVEVGLSGTLPASDGPVATVELRGTARVNDVAAEGVKIVPADPLTVAWFRKEALRFRLRVFLGGALPL